MAETVTDSNAIESISNVPLDISLIDESLKSGFDQVSISLDRLVSIKNEEMSVDQFQQIVNESTEILSDSINNLADTRWTEAIILLVIGATIAALTAFVFNLLNWRIINRNEKISVLGKNLVDQIDRFEQISIEYWMQPYKKESEIELCCMEATIKSLHSSIRASSRMFELMLPIKLQVEIRAKCNSFAEKSFDLVTGGDFETKQRQVSKEKVNQILAQCQIIKSTVLSEIYK